MAIDTLSETIKIKSPVNGEEIGEIQSLSKDQIDVIIDKAQVVQKAWAKTPVNQRADLLYKWADLLLERKETIGEIITKEVGKPYKASVTEVERTVDFIRYTAEDGLRMDGQLTRSNQFPSDSGSRISMASRKPVGIVLAISPFNYPINLAAAKLAPAVVAGNAVVFKPATQGALTGRAMLEALQDAGLPEGLVAFATGRGSVIGDHLVQHPAVNMISFTGSTAVGSDIAKKTTMKSLSFELGGKDPAIVLDDANLDLAAKEIVSGAFSYSGQRCTAIKRVLVMDSVADELVAKLKQKIEGLSVGSPWDNADVVPLIDEKSANFVKELIDDAVAKNAETVLGGEQLENLIHPTLLDHVTEDMRIAWEEPFGPVLPIIRVASKDEAIRIANKSEYGLQASLFTENINDAFIVADEIEAGTVQLNGKTQRGPDHFPFLGTKGSGIGEQGIRKSIESMTVTKSVVLNLQ
ncbi:NADP-dependent glyceraldehyde-3-phosphate dehydrogenase [Radiobacillus kanasensis]|uniref:NADP-dependent glyceraldehyde-3-phosphate dehydrogenase n=1 Tax=Radiobacillus kanasensis TaxID=2844358 RepID=UPI001E4ABF18|nr:NADP-dependent glyceraldehyde-3-phosphate dehydrogenase [Radiobacillus kanasensis]UFU00060.1 NADP-dependent glyceraldehyde-3-phosphate dehydrogenase [Radiobacillus kanasensis]